MIVSSQRSASRVSDAETLCRFERRSPTEVVARQRVLRFLTPNPNSAEGLLWSEAQVRFPPYSLLIPFRFLLSPSDSIASSGRGAGSRRPFLIIFRFLLYSFASGAGRRPPRL